jgi:hypothetical protein
MVLFAITREVSEGDYLMAPAAGIQTQNDLGRWERGDGRYRC